MDLLLVAATLAEADGIIADLNLKPKSPGLWRGKSGDYRIDLLITGIGMVNCSFALGSYLATKKPDLAVQFGIAGSFDPDLPLATVVELVADGLPELGAESPGGWLDLKALGFPLLQIGDGVLYNMLPQRDPSPHDIPKLWGATVNRVHGEANSIREFEARHTADVESMEGAAFFHAMIKTGLRFYAFRSISNYVEPRNRDAWKIPEAVDAMRQFLVTCIDCGQL